MKGRGFPFCPNRFVWLPQVTSWLIELRALRDADGRAHEALGEGSSDEGGSDREQPCPDCGRTYAHEHVRAIYSRHDESGSDKDD